MTVVSEKIQEVLIVKDPEEESRVHRSHFADAQEWDLYPSIEVDEVEIPYGPVKRSALQVKCKAARRFWYYVWNNYYVTVSAITLVLMF